MSQSCHERALDTSLCFGWIAYFLLAYFLLRGEVNCFEVIFTLLCFSASAIYLFVENRFYFFLVFQISCATLIYGFWIIAIGFYLGDMDEGVLGLVVSGVIVFIGIAMIGFSIYALSAAIKKDQSIK